MVGKEGYKIPKEILGLAGEYAVASEICRRGFFAQIAYGRWKNVDVLAVNPDNGKTVLVEVKTKQDREWPAVKGIKGSNRLLILVDFENKNESERADFYILDENDWQEYLKKYILNSKNFDRLENGYIPVWQDGYKGTSVRPEQVMEHKERWDKLIKILTS